MDKTILKILLCFIASSALIATLLLCINFIAMAFLQSDGENIYPGNTRYVLEQISKNISVSGDTVTLHDESVIPAEDWCILIDEQGNVIWEQNKPADIPSHYTLNDIAKMTHWYLNDYPVYVRAEDYGLLVLGIPKNSVGKYEIEYSMAWFDSLPRRVLLILAVNLVLATLLACLFGIYLYKRLKALTRGMKDLRHEKPVNLKESGIFKELSRNLNETSAAMARKNRALQERDSARSHWIAGISHDIRTPLTMIMGYSESIAGAADVSAENRKKAEIITGQSLKVKNLIADLNLISSLEYDMQPSRKKPLRICPLLRNIVSELLNNGLPSKYELRLDFTAEQAMIMGDASLLERAFVNLLNNSIAYNEDGCVIDIRQYCRGDRVYIEITDNGCGVPDEVLAHIAEIPKTAHGLGLPMAYKIIGVHGGKFEAANNHGFSVLISLPAV